MTDLETRLRKLEDRAALTELVARYAMLVAQGEGASVAALFAEDGRFRAGQRTAEGGEALRAFFANLRPLGTIPLVGNLVLEIDGDEAGGRSTLYARVPGETLAVYSGWYEDTFRRVRGEWKFASRDFDFYHDSSGNAAKR